MMSKARKHRMALALPSELNAVLSEISETTGIAATAFVTAVLVDMLPYFHQVQKALKQAEKSKGDALDTLTDTLFQAQSKASQLGMDIGEMKKATKTRRPRKAKQVDTE